MPQVKKKLKILKMTHQRKLLGTKGEELALNLLKKKKYRILERNYRTNLGEIDILAQDGKTLVVVEVKTKTDRKKGSAIEMITPAKQKKLILLTLQLQKQTQSDNVRIDVVTVDQGLNNPQIRHHRGVIEYYG